MPCQSSRCPKTTKCFLRLQERSGKHIRMHCVWAPGEGFFVPAAKLDFCVEWEYNQFGKLEFDKGGCVYEVSML